MFGLVWSRSCVFICNFQERRSADIYYVRLDLEADSYNKPSKLKMAKKFITCLWSNLIALSIIKNSTHQYTNFSTRRHQHYLSVQEENAEYNILSC